MFGYVNSVNVDDSSLDTVYAPSSTLVDDGIAKLPCFFTKRANGRRLDAIQNVRTTRAFVARAKRSRRLVDGSSLLGI